MKGPVRGRSGAQNGLCLRRGLAAAALALGAVSAPAWAQDSAHAEVQDLDALLNTPVSTAAKYAQGVRQVAGSVTIVTAEDIQRFGYRSLDDVLQSAAGFYLTYDRQYAYVGVRGFGRANDQNNRILLLLDGHTVNEGLTGSSQIASSMVLDLTMVKRIEIVRGPASALYGTGALLAVVNVITESEDHSGVQARAGLGSAGYRETSVTTSTKLGSAHLAFSGTWDERDGKDLYFPEYNAPATNNGIVSALDWEKRAGFYGTARLGSFSLRGRYGRRSKGLPTGAYGSEFNHPGTERVDASAFAELRYESDLSDSKHLTLRGFVDDYDISGQLFISGLPTSIHGNNRMVGGEAAFRWEPVASSRLTLGTEYRDNSTVTMAVNAGPYPVSLIDQPFSVLSLYGQEDLQVLSNLSVLAGVRHDRNSVTGPATTPRLAVIYDPWRGTTLKAMYGHAFRAATPLEDATRLAPASGHLVPERLKMTELIWIQRLTAELALTGSVYQYRVQDLISQVRDSVLQLAFVNHERVRARGMELVLDTRPSPGTRGYLSFSEQRAVGDAGDATGDALTNSPHRLVKAGFAQDLGLRASAAAQLTWGSSRGTLAGTTTGAVLLANVNLVVRPFPFAEVGIRAVNLFNTRYAHPAGTELRQDTIEQNRRTLSLSLTTRF